MTGKTKRIGYYLERTNRMVKLEFHKLFKALDIDLTPEQWVILERLYYENGLSQNQLASDSFKNAPTISRIIDLLEDKGWVERKRFKDDRRRYKIYLNSAGHAIVERLNNQVETVRKKGWHDLSESDYETFTNILNRIFINYSEKD